LTFKDLNLKKGYNSDNNNQEILNGFYIPSLSLSKEYWRLTGYFSSGSIRAAALGIRQLIQNHGTMRLITGLEFSTADKKAIKDGLDTTEGKITKKFSKIIDELKDEDFTLQPAKVLGWMLKNGRLEIKIAEVEGTGISHPKIGIMFDEEKNSISFSGSNNETGNGWTNNIEEFKVFKEFEFIESEFYKIDFQMFEKFWNGITERCTIHELPGPIIDKLIELAPEKIEELDMGYNDGITAPVQPLSLEDDLWPHQKIAIQAWLSPNDWQNNLDTELSTYLTNQSTTQPSTQNHPNQGILAMATGSGKTRTAIAAALHAPNEVITIVALPLTILPQWEDEIRSWIPENLKMVYAHSEPSGNWKELLPTHLGAYRLGAPSKTTSRLFVLGSYDTISSKEFVDLFDGIESKYVQFFGDEVHNFGTDKRNYSFNIKADRVMGLSATHTRHWDDPGTREIENHFGKPVYEFNIQDGIDHNYLCRYNYHIDFVPLSESELEDYHRESINQGYYDSKIKSTTDTEKAKFESLLQISRNVRSKILRKAENKPKAVFDILQNHFSGEHEKAIIFVEDEEQLSSVEQVLKKQNKSYFVYHSGLTAAQKTTALRDFKEATTSRFLVGKRMLDEGLDVPDSDKCIVVASTTNPRQYIQRRGRVLRISANNPNKIANIFDPIVVPDYSVPSHSLSDAEESKATEMGKILSKEIVRIVQLNSSSNNQQAVLQKLDSYIRSHNLQNYVNTAP
tara:strand:- start:10029 stop:12239 length:2211 start_codon:yes stop_codon:yes gene_type:complete